MKTRKARVFVGDFETTVYDGQEYTEVWASACVEVGGEDVSVFSSIDEQFDYFISLACNLIVYYHNLKFDGSFWLDYLLTKKGFKQAAYAFDPEDTSTFKWQAIKDMKDNTLQYLISNMGAWYSVVIKVKGKIIELRDSLKLLPFSVEQIGKSFATKHKKLSIEYTGFRYAGCEITEEEKAYISNDVLVVKEALEIMFTEGHNRLTIGSCCLAEYTRIIGHKAFERWYPDLTKIYYGNETADAWVRRAYRGGWCYLVKGKENRVFHNGTTADVNSLYPSVMSLESGNKYPIGTPTFWKGNYIPNEAESFDKFYFVRIKTRFKIKTGKLPFIQLKGNFLYPCHEMLETSDIYTNGKYYREYIDLSGDIQQARPTITMAENEYRLFREHYDVEDFEIIDGCYFNASVGIFDDYIEKYKKLKMESEGARRSLAKLFLNNLYGKMASSDCSSFKVAQLNDDKTLSFFTVVEHNKKVGYIPVGAAITAYAREFTIRAAQKNFYGCDKPGFIYADTDSIHCDLQPDELKGVREDPTKFLCWKFETCWDEAIFVRQKTYIEHVTHENRKAVECYYNVKCAGMPNRCKELLIESITGERKLDTYTEGEKKFLLVRRKLTDFKLGLAVPSKLKMKRIRGGVILANEYYKMR